MSSNTMLKQAIIDADALREVALKNAEAIVVNKYSNQIKEAVDTMLEQEEDEMFPPEEEGAEEMGMEMPMADPGGLPASRAAMAPETEPATNLEDQATLAAVGGERLCPCPDTGTTIEIDFAGLQNMMQKLEEPQAGGMEPELEMPPEEGPLPPPEPEEVLPDEEEIMLEIDDLLEDDEEGALQEKITAHSEKDPEKASAEKKAEKTTQPKKSKKFQGLAPKELDPPSTKTHAGPRPQRTGPIPDEPLPPKKNHPKKEKVQKMKEALLRENSSLTKTNSKVLNENKILRQEQQHIIKENKDLKGLLKKVSGKLEEVNLSNAKLVYTNQILNNTSLNERQKQRIVESINGADSVDAAKSIYETLQSAVGSSLGSRNESQSLSEAITRGNTTMLRQKQKDKRQDPHMERMKKLAGI